MKKDRFVKMGFYLVVLFFGFLYPVKQQAFAYEEILSEIRLFPYERVPAGWVEAAGQSIPIANNEALYSLIGNQYGGNEYTFHLPDLRGANPLPKVRYAMATSGSYPSSTPFRLGDIKLLLTSVANLTNYKEALAEGQAIPKSHPLSNMYGNLFGGTESISYLPHLKGANPYSGVHYMITMDGFNTAEPFLGEIRLYAVGQQPDGWIRCDGSTLVLSQHTALYALIGTIYGGDGMHKFGIPDLRETVPLPNTDYYIATQGVFPSLW